MQDRRKREIRIKADTLRANLKKGRYGIIDLFSECKQLGFHLLRYPLGEDASLGFTLKKDNDIIIFTNSCSRLSREIFTLAHEMGHAILHLNGEQSFLEDNGTIHGLTEDEREDEANYFAACLLLPVNDISRFMDMEIHNLNEKELSALDIARIMSAFNVSFDMALNRLESLGFINLNQKRCLDNEKTKIRVGNLLRSVGGNAGLNEASKVTDLPYEYMEYAIYNYNHNAIPIETLERVLSYYYLTLEDVSDKMVKHNNELEEDLDDLIGVLED